MKHFAKVKDGIVEQVIVADQEFISTLSDAQDWVETDPKTFGNKHAEDGTPLRGNFASAGFMYDKENDVFHEPQPTPEAVLDTKTWLWTNLPVVELDKS